jgi:hypothetical protein
LRSKSIFYNLIQNNLQLKQNEKNTFNTITKIIFRSTRDHANSIIHILLKKVAFQTSSIVPAARGDVKITKDDNKTI